MHSRIIQLSVEPIEDEDFLTEDVIIQEYDIESGGAVWSVADYVYEVDANEVIGNVLEFLPMSYIDLDKKDRQMVVFQEGFKKKYFESRLIEVKQKISLMSAEVFSGDEPGLYAISKLIEDRFSLYVYGEEGFTMTFDRFVRDYLSEGESYYIGGAVGYHA